MHRQMKASPEFRANTIQTGSLKYASKWDISNKKNDFNYLFDPLNAFQFK